MKPRQGRPSRRNLLAGVAGSAAAIGGAVAIAQTRQATPANTEPTSAGGIVPATGATQAGIDRPATPQLFGLVMIYDLAAPDDLAFLATLGRDIATLVEDPPADLLPDGAVGLTVTVGLGPRMVSHRRPDLPGAESLPPFAGDETIAPDARGGDLLVMACAEDPTVLAPVVDRLLAAVPGVRVRWGQRCFRGAPPSGSGTIIRNPLGFHDNVQIPHTDEELAANVWLEAPLAGGTLCVVRRLRVDLDGFRGLPTSRREEVIGRRLDGTPLSGGLPFDPVDITAKAANGELLIPAHAHVRAAHPSFTASHLMLRRGYAYDNGDGDSGLMFICFQRDLRTYVLTQQRLDSLDELMTYVSPTGSASFLILPGHHDDRPLGAELL